MLLKQGVSLCAQCVGCVLCDPGLVQKLTLLSKAAQTAGTSSRPLHLVYPELPHLLHLSGQRPSVHVSKLASAHIIYMAAASNVVPSPLPPAAPCCSSQFLLPKLTPALALCGASNLRLLHVCQISRLPPCELPRAGLLGAQGRTWNLGAIGCLSAETM